MKMKDQLTPKGRVEMFVTKGRPSIRRGPVVKEIAGLKMYQSADIDFSNVEILQHEDFKNIVFNQGKNRVIESLTTGFIRVIARMAVGDRGTIPSDSTVPKVPTADMTGLYNEVYRDDVDTTVLNLTDDDHEVKFIKIFSAVDIPITAFSNQANPVINEAALIMCDLLSGNPLPRPAVAYPNTPDADEVAFSMRAFKSIPFEAANDISVTIRYTIFIE